MRSYAEISDKTSTYEYFGDTIQPKTTFFTSQCLSFTCETGLLTIPTLWGWYKDSVVRAGKAFEVSCPQHTASDWQVSAITIVLSHDTCRCCPWETFSSGFSAPHPPLQAPPRAFTTHRRCFKAGYAKYKSLEWVRFLYARQLWKPSWRC